jgi:16S rRNA (cytosine967-C5)-methyltransferase
VKAVLDDGTSYHGEIADRLLVDAPCTGLGVLSKKPDIKWKREPEDIAGLTALQLQLLENAALLVKPGGVIVYSTCTIEPEENSGLVRRFLTLHPSFVVDDPRKFVPAELTSDEGYVSTLPSLHHMDGSFAVRLIRNM